MVISTQSGPIERAPSDAVVVGILEGKRRLGGAAAAVDRASGKAISACLASKDFTGKKNQTVVLYIKGRPKFKRVILVGLGNQASLDDEVIRQAAGRAISRARELRVNTVTAHIFGVGEGGVSPFFAARAFAEGAILANYSYDEYRSRSADKRHRVRRVSVLESDKETLTEIRKGVARGRIGAEGASFTRDLCNTPRRDLTPTIMAGKAKELASSAKTNITVTILDEKQIRANKMGCLLAVAKGSDEPPRFVILDYTPKEKSRGTICIVGKGITFDTGGISLKSADGMDRMKYDMSGAAAIFGTFQCIARLQPDVRVIGLTPLTENMPGGHATTPGDVVTSMAGLTVEINNTDAEGRLVLADALHYAKKYRPDAIINLATLTGAVIIALGSHTSGVMGNNEDFLAEVIDAGERSGENVWQLPTWDAYRDLLRSDIADMKNSAGREAGTIAGAMFLKEYVGKTAWVHVDIAGTAWTDRDRPYAPKGSTGVGVRMLLELIENWKK